MRELLSVPGTEGRTGTGQIEKDRLFSAQSGRVARSSAAIPDRKTVFIQTSRSFSAGSPLTPRAPRSRAAVNPSKGF
jgi:hypothetical protein